MLNLINRFVSKLTKFNNKTVIHPSDTSIFSTLTMLTEAQIGSYLGAVIAQLETQSDALYCPTCTTYLKFPALMSNLNSRISCPMVRFEKSTHI